MALQVWLPLNGNLNNQGLRDSSISTSGNEYSNGKVTSKSIKLSSSITTDIDASLYQHKSCSFGGWVKYNSSEIKTKIESYSYDSTYQSFTSVIFGYLSYGGLGLLVTSNNMYSAKTFSTLNVVAGYRDTSQGGNSIVNTTSEIIPLDVWNFIFMTWNKELKEISMYFNNIKHTIKITKELGTTSFSGKVSINASGILSGNSRMSSLPCYVNDFRFYDECLSDKEIKELSRGLCLHYKLSRGGENLYSIDDIYGWTVNTSESGAFSHTIEQNHIKLTCTKASSGSATSGRGPYFYTHWTFESGKKYTISFKYKINTTSNNGKNLIIGFEKLPAQNSKVIINGETVSVTKTVMHSSSATSHSTVFTVYSAALWSVGDVIDIWDVKIEEGDHATSWIPNKSDTLYSQLGYSSTEPDCSGYGNDGTIKGTPVYSNNTPRYEGSNYFGYDQNVQGNFGFNGFPITISFWAKVAAFDTSGWVVLAGQSTGYYLDADSSSAANWHSKATVQGYYRDGVLIASTNTTSQFISRDGNWHHYAYVCTLTDWTKMTVNGGSLWSSSWRAKVNISDFRIYATALSASDIKALYDTPISIDNKNNLHSLEFIENSQENLLDNLNTQYTQKGSMSNSYNTSQPCFVPYNQTNCKCQYGSKPGFNFIRVANINDYASGGRTTYGGPRIDFTNKPLLKGHSYIMIFDYEGHFDTTSFGYTRWSYNEGWEGDNTLMPSPTQIIKIGTVSTANAEVKNRFIYAFTINDDIYKVCKTSFSSFVAGTSYLSYRYFAWHYAYATSGTGQGTDAYLTNFKMYDITSYVNSESFSKEGLIKMVDMDDFLSESKVHKYGLISMNDFTEF